MNYLTLVPQGGLCNRLRAVLSAVSLVETLFPEARLRVGWSADAECAARFDQLFEPLSPAPSAQAAPAPSAQACSILGGGASESLPSAQASESLPFLTIGPRRWFDRPVTRRNLHWPALVRSVIYSAQYRNTPPAVEDLRGKVYVSTGHAFCDYSPAYVRRLRPLPHLQQRIDALSADFDAHTVGIHIRRTDHSTAIAESPDSLFVDAIAAAIVADPEARFFLATDDSALKARLAEQFPGRITQQECSGTRSDLRGMEEAVVDLWTLARTSRIIGSFWSSYTDTAAEIGQIPLTIIRK